MLPGIAIFGTDSISQILIPSLRLNGFDIQAIWSNKLKAAVDMGQNNNIDLASDQIDLVLLNKNVQLIIVACSPNYYAKILPKATNLGKHVLCDISTCISKSQFEKLVLSAIYYPTLLSILLNPLRFLSSSKEAQRLIRSSWIGDVKVITATLVLGKYSKPNNWTMNIDDDTTDRKISLSDIEDSMGGGCLHGYGKHIIDLISFLFDRQAKKVIGTCKTYRKFLETPIITERHTNLETNGKRLQRMTADDFVTFSLDFGDDKLANVVLNGYQTCSEFSQDIVISGSDGYLRLRDEHLYGCQTNDLSKETHQEKAILIDSDEDYLINPSVLIKLKPKPYVKGLDKLVSALKATFTNKNKDKSDEELNVSNCSALDKDCWSQFAHEGRYIHSVIDAIKRSDQSLQWTKII